MAETDYFALAVALTRGRMAAPTSARVLATLAPQQVDVEPEQCWFCSQAPVDDVWYPYCTSTCAVSASVDR